MMDFERLKIFNSTLLRASSLSALVKSPNILKRILSWQEQLSGSLSRRRGKSCANSIEKTGGAKGQKMNLRVRSKPGFLPVFTVTYFLNLSLKVRAESAPWERISTNFSRCFACTCSYTLDSALKRSFRVLIRSN